VIAVTFNKKIQLALDLCSMLGHALCKPLTGIALAARPVMRSMWFSFSTALLLVMFTPNAQAETATIALTAAAADTASTAAALSSGLAELNPLGLAGTVVIKVATIAYINQLPEEDRSDLYGLASSLWGGATANNLCWLTGVGPACLVLGVVAGNYMWSSGAEERHYWASCKSKRLGNSDAPCSRSEKNMTVDTEPALAQAP